MAGPRLPRNERLQDSKGQVDQRFLRFWDQVKGRAYDSIRAFASLTASADVDPDNDYVPLFDASEGVTRKALVSAITGVRQKPTYTILTTSDSSYTPPADCLFVVFMVQAAGSRGSTGNTRTSPLYLSGGASGTYAQVTVTASDIASGVSVSIGAANSGDPTSIGAPVSVSCPSSSSASTSPGAATGTVDFQIQGRMGQNIGTTTDNLVQSPGRDSPLGQGSATRTEAATGYGAGGASGSNSSNSSFRNPSNGSDGCIIAVEYY
jgi:hypothetical protein